MIPLFVLFATIDFELNGLEPIINVTISHPPQEIRSFNIPLHSIYFCVCVSFFFFHYLACIYYLICISCHVIQTEKPNPQQPNIVELCYNLVKIGSQRNFDVRFLFPFDSVFLWLCVRVCLCVFLWHNSCLSNIHFFFKSSAPIERHANQLIHITHHLQFLHLTRPNRVINTHT